ncbi:ABC transporter ATP-binding protein [Thiocapsa sp.]|uniref:ABC transporter ATP-binding protein n=1 Tax=Thiocapsa sp. TaxID=2024551 RepID=UPI0025DF48CD|nr:ABC transporter ATP-binding protein [Thiocapsa sp.]
MDTLARVTDLSRRFGARRALCSLDLELRQGEVVGLLGPNGAGKTTCLRLLSGTLAPSGGRVEILDIDLARHPVAAKRHLGYLPERPPLYPELRVDEYLRHCARLHRVPRADVADEVDRAKQRCGLDAVGRTLIAKLSKGFRQRLGIAQAILHRPKLLILDEPTEGLDPVQIREVRGLIRDLSRDCGIILSSHILSEVQAVCDRVLVLHQGRMLRSDRFDALGPTALWRVRLLGGDDSGACSGVERLERLACVEAAVALGEDRFRVILTEGAESADLARQMLTAGLDLCELGPERPDLERVFFDLIGAGGTP